MKNNRFDIYEMVNKLIIERLQAGVIPWQRPWKSSGAMPRNLVSKKVYRGFNFWYLLSFDFENPLFLTFNQVTQLGGSIIKGSKSYQVIFWKLREYTKEGVTEEVPMLRYYRIFHIDSVTGIDSSKITVNDSHDHEFDPIGECDQLVEFWNDSPTIEFGSKQACYMPAQDKVKMPNPRTFFEDEKYYSTLFHELVHSTGHRSRLNRHEKFPNQQFGSKDYSQEELVAEMGAAYLCGICGIENLTIDNSAAYIESWLKKLKSDNKFVIMAASYAQKAVDYILGNQKPPEATTINNPEKETTPVSFSLLQGGVS